MRNAILLSLLIVCLTAGIAGATMEKGPYLLYPGVNDEMQVLWQVSGTETGTLEWGTTTSYSDGSVNTSQYGENQHTYTITGLTPGVKYYYRVYASGEWHEGSFTAAPADVDVGNVKFLAYGDTRTNPTQHNKVTDDMIETYTADPDYQTIALLSGDWSERGNESNWTNEFFNRGQANNLEFRAHVPINGCIGNHEDDGSVYHKYYPYPYVSNSYWSFDYGPVHIAVVDVENVSYTTGSTQHNWLKNDLETTTKEWKIVMYHAPAWAAGDHSNNTTAQTHLQPLFVANGVDLVINGHNHNYVRCVVNGVVHITTGGGGAPLDGVFMSWPYVVYGAGNTLSYCKIDVQGYDLTFTAVKSPENTVLESFTLSHEVPNPPDPATNPGPADTATDVSIFDVISWDAGSYVLSHDVYFGTNPIPGAGEFMGNQGGTTYDPGTLATSTTYYWAIDEVNPVGTTTGPVWSFTTQDPEYPGDPSGPDPADGITDIDLTGMLSWTAGAGTDDSDVYFGTNPVPTDWLGNTSNTTIDYGTLSTETTYYWQVLANNYFGATAGPIWEFTTMPPDTAPPTPEPATFESGPTALSTTMITMTATTGDDRTDPVEYFFTETSGNPGGSDSGWQTSASYTDTGLSEITEYCYSVKMRDGVGNVGLTSVSVCETTPADSTPPTPDPASFAVAPAGITLSAVKMTAAAGSDDNGPVEYLFDATNGGNDSGWITNPIYIDSGLAEDTSYSYTVTMRDALLNIGGTSSSASGTTFDSEYIIEQNNNENDKVDVKDGQDGAQSFKHGSDGDPTYQITKVELLLSRESDAPSDDLHFTIGTSRNGGTISGSAFDISPSSVTNSSGGSNFMTYTITYSTPVGPLNANTTYYLNYETGGNGKAYFLGYNGNSSYGNGTYYKDGSDDSKDSYFKIFGSAPEQPDTDAPLPDPATFAFFPQATGVSSIIMSATTGADVTGPVEYFFDETTGGGSDSGWITSDTYEDTGLADNTEFTYTVTMRDDLGNEGGTSAPASATTELDCQLAPVPNVVGLLSGAADALLNANHVSGGSTASVNDSSPAGTVLTQSAVGGCEDVTFVVTYTVSTGCTAVPDVVGMLSGAADAALNANHVSGGSTASVYDASPAGTVLTQSAVGGCEGAAFVVTYTVSTGCFPVPDVVGLLSGAADAALNTNHVSGGSTASVNDSSPAGTVLTQSAVGGCEGAAFVVTYTVSTGCFPVPNVVGLLSGAADTLLNTNHVSGGSTASINDSSPAGTVLTQSAVGGCEDGTFVVTYTVSTGCTPVPDVVGLLQGAADAALNANHVSGGSTGSAYDETPVGTVLTQSTVGGCEGGAFVVTYTVSLGVEPVTVPVR